MGMHIHNELPRPEFLKSEFPLSENMKKQKAMRDAEIRKVFTGETDKFILIVQQTRKILYVNT